MVLKITLKSIILVFLCPIFGVAQSDTSSKLKVSIDIESAERIIQLLSKKKADTIELRKAAGLYGNRLLIEKVKGYSGAGEDIFINSLKEMIETGTIKGNDPYNWKQVKTQLPAIKQLLSYISSNKAGFISEVSSIIQPYTPADLAADARACFLAGGGSLGFTIGYDPTFNVALQKIGDDLEGLKYLVAHELYHTLQDIGQRTRVYKRDNDQVSYTNKASYNLLYSLWAEGIANFVADMSLIKDNRNFSKEQKEQYEKNYDRRYQNFQLFEAMLYRQYYDSTANYQAMYEIGFTTAFDETGYFVGYEMAKQLVKHQGKNAIAELLTKDPIRFTADYIALYKKRTDDKSFIRFSKPVEIIVENLMVLEDKM